MTPKEALEAYYYYTGKVSDVIRQLGFAAIGVTWAFKVDVAGRPRLSPRLLSAARLAVASLACDLLQYIYGSAVWGIFHRMKEKEDAAEFTAPPWINWLALLFFWSKAVLMVASYFYILWYLSGLFTADDRRRRGWRRGHGDRAAEAVAAEGEGTDAEVAMRLAEENGQ